MSSPPPDAYRQALIRANSSPSDRPAPAPAKKGFSDKANPLQALLQFFSLTHPDPTGAAFEQLLHPPAVRTLPPGPQGQPRNPDGSYPYWYKKGDPDAMRYMQGQQVIPWEDDPEPLTNAEQQSPKGKITKAPGLVFPTRGPVPKRVPMHEFLNRILALPSHFH